MARYVRARWLRRGREVEGFVAPSLFRRRFLSVAVCEVLSRSLWFCFVAGFSFSRCRSIRFDFPNEGPREGDDVERGRRRPCLSCRRSRRVSVSRGLPRCATRCVGARRRRPIQSRRASLPLLICRSQRKATGWAGGRRATGGYCRILPRGKFNYFGIRKRKVSYALCIYNQLYYDT